MPPTKRPPRIIKYLDPISVRSPFTASRLAVFADGTTRPVLEVLAERRFGTAHGAFPFWLDGNFRNETEANVGLAPTAPKRPYRRLNIPPGPDYQKEWRKRSQEKIERYRELRRKRARSLRHLVGEYVLRKVEED